MVSSRVPREILHDTRYGLRKLRSELIDSGGEPKLEEARYEILA